MHFSTTTIVALLSAATALAAPAANAEPLNFRQSTQAKKQYIKDCKKDFDYKWSHDGWKNNEKVFYFDTEYIVKATPDQVIASDQTPAPGEPGAKGLFKYGINIAENTICYVSRPPLTSSLSLSLSLSLSPRTILTPFRTSPSAA
jgi:hypothetical protein